MSFRKNTWTAVLALGKCFCFPFLFFSLYIKQERECLTSFPKFEKRVENTNIPYEIQKSNTISGFKGALET